jgi:hypothetical protein
MGLDSNTDFGDGYDGVLPDVSNGEPPMQSDTALGNGSGYYVDNNYANGLFGTVQTALNYAIQRDQQKIAMAHAPAYGYPGLPLAASPQAVQQARNSRLMLFLLIGAGVFLVAREK